MSFFSTSGIDTVARASAAAAGHGLFALVVASADMNNYTAPAPAGWSGALSDMEPFAFESLGANTAAMTLNIGGLGALPITHIGGAALISGDVPAIDTLVELFYDASANNFHAQLLRQPSSVMPLVDSLTGAIGVSTRFARADHAHPAESFNTANVTPIPSTNSNISVLHGSTTPPKSALLQLLCLGADGGYAVGDILSQPFIATSTFVPWPLSTWFNSTHVGFYISNTFFFCAPRKDTGAGFILALNNWAYRFVIEL